MAYNPSYWSLTIRGLILQAAAFMILALPRFSIHLFHPPSSRPRLQRSKGRWNWTLVTLSLPAFIIRWRRSASDSCGSCLEGMWPVQNNPLCMSYEKNMCLSIKLYIYIDINIYVFLHVLYSPCSLCCLYQKVPGTRRGGSFQKLDIAIGTSLLVGIVGELARGELKWMHWRKWMNDWTDLNWT